MRILWLVAIVAVVLPLLDNSAGVSSAEPSIADSPGDVAAEVDRLLSEEVGLAADQATSRCSDEVFLRRAFLDLVGQPPTLDDILVFTLDANPNKRADLVDSLLKGEGFGRNWGRYWRDVIFYRRTEERSLLASQPTADWLADQLNQNATWDKIATQLITASGDVREDGSTGLIMAQGGLPEETVSEVSRIFLGIQIQCAQCHDHPTDRWKREQFHQLAAFFPRVSIRPNNDGDRRSFMVVATDNPPRFFRPMGNNRFIGTAEHRMLDLDDPSARGELMQPVFFATGQSLVYGVNDAERRGTLAEWLTSGDCEWFAKAFVNRVWAELVGEGFYEPVDDMGPDRDCSAPETLDYLATAFADNGYDVKWAYRTIMATAAYQQDSQSRRTPDQTPFQANCPQRLRSDQLLDAITTALQMPPAFVNGGAGRGPYGVQAGPRTIFNQVFGYDPSERREEVSGTIQQTLAMMNSPMINGSIAASPFTGLGRLLAQQDDDETVTIELYLRALSRQPTDDEIKTCLEYVRETGNRREAFEDVLWALINSTEFLHRR